MRLPALGPHTQMRANFRQLTGRIGMMKKSVVKGRRGTRMAGIFAVCQWLLYTLLLVGGTLGQAGSMMRRAKQEHGNQCCWSSEERAVSGRLFPLAQTGTNQPTKHIIDTQTHNGKSDESRKSGKNLNRSIVVQVIRHPNNNRLFGWLLCRGLPGRNGHK